MSDEEFVDWTRGHLVNTMNRFWQEGKLLEYRFGLIRVDLLEAKTVDDMLVLSKELQIGVWEKERSLLLERMNKGLELIREEQDEKRKAKYWKHYEALEEKWQELGRNFNLETKYRLEDVE